MAKKPATRAKRGATDERAPASAGDEIAGTSQGDKGNAQVEDMVKLAREIYEAGYLKDRDNQDEAYKDLKFIAGEEQWDPKALQLREDEERPALVVNQCPQFVRQVTGDMRQMRPAIKCVPITDDASKDVAAKILPGLIRYIESRSDASGIYFSAADQQVGAGIGHWMVTHEYSSARTFNQEIRIAPVPDGIAVVWDADAVLPTREDATDCFVPFDMSRRVFEKKYPGKGADFMSGSPECFSSWFRPDMVRIAIWFHKVPETKRLAVYEDGRIDDVTDDPEGEAEAKQIGAQIEEREGVRVDRYLVSANDVLEGPEKVPGPNIPVVPLIGEEVIIGPKVVRRGVIRVLRDVQRIFNYAISTQTEVVALQPKAPFIGTRDQFEKYADQWETANSKNWPYLEYDHQAGVPPPQRVQPAVSSSGIDDLMRATQEAMHSTTGIYPAALGARSNETSGRAILARQREGDTGTYVYLDNFGRAIRRTGQIIVDMAPDIYDTRRTIQIVGEDGKIDSMEINKAGLDGDAETHVSLNDVTKGAYLVAVEMGPSHSSKREEAREGMLEMMRALGNQGMVLADLYAKQQDFPLSDKIAERLKFLLPPAIQAKEAAEAGEPPPQLPPPPPPTPEQQAAMEEERQKNIELARKNEIEDRKQSLEFERLDVEKKKLVHGAMQGAMEHERAMSAPAPAKSGRPAPADPVDRAQQEDIDDLKGHVAQMTDEILRLREIVDHLSERGAPDINPMDGLELGAGPVGPNPPPAPGPEMMDPGGTLAMGQELPPVP